jgi:excisionase family DNA binding protein
MMIPFQERLTCTVDEATQAIGLGRSKVYELIRSRALETTTVGKRRLIYVSSLMGLLRRNSAQCQGVE